MFREPRDPRLLDSSRAAVADGHFVPVDDDRHRSSATGHCHHLFQKLGVFLHVVVLDPSIRIGLTGRGGVGSAGLTVDLDFVRHA